MVDQLTPLGNSVPVAGSSSLPSVGPRPTTNSTTGASSAKPEASSASTPTTTAAAAQLNQHLQQSQSGLEVQVDPSTHRVIFQVIQKGTGQVLLQFPSEELLGMSRRLQQLESQQSGSGALVDKQG